MSTSHSQDILVDYYHITIGISDRYVKEALFSCCAFKSILHCLIEDLHPSEPSTFQIWLRKTINRFTLYMSGMQQWNR